jgi:DNA polymerase V
MVFGCVAHLYCSNAIQLLFPAAIAPQRSLLFCIRCGKLLSREQNPEVSASWRNDDAQRTEADKQKIKHMEGEEFYGAAYKGSKNFTQQQVKTANATGFGAAADDYAERGIDLNEQLIRNKPATFFFKMKGDAMKEAGIFDGDTLIVDRSLKLVNGKVIVAILNGELLVRRFHKNFSSAFLIAENERYKNINLAEFTNFSVWGIVTYTIHPV